MEHARRIAAQWGLKIRMLPMVAADFAKPETIKAPVGPGEWITLIQNADFVLTDSFHCTVFSIIFGRSFYTLQRFAENDIKGQNSRVHQLLQRSLLQERLLIDLSISTYSKLHDRFESAGFGVHYVIPKGKNLIRNISQMFRLMKKGHYDGVHVHFEEWSFLYLMIARLCGIKLRVCHAHMAFMPGTDTKLHYRLFRVLLNYFATERLACSKDAGEHLYGKHPYKILNNAIEAQQYRFNPVIREKVRKSLGVEDKLVIGVVGSRKKWIW